MTPLAYVSVRPLPVGPVLPQSEGVAWMQAALERSGVTGDAAVRARRLYGLLARQATVGSRATCLEDFTHQDWDRMRLFAATPSGDGQAAAGGRTWTEPLLEDRMEVFAETALRTAREAFAADAEAPDALVQVSCTGYDSPTAVQRVALEKGWRPRILHIGHMGCYAALPALATAADLVAATAAQRAAAGAGAERADATAAILLVELCTLHHKIEATAPEVIVQQCLFADGAARLDVSAAPPAAGGFALLAHHEALVPDSLDEMTWRVADSAFAMTLSRRVPDFIQAGLGGVVDGFLAEHGLARGDLDVAAVHPGGPRVIEAAQDALGLVDAQVAHSRAVLFDRGNMSSTTLPHIWDRIAGDDAIPAGALVLSLAFGPGLTIAANLMRKGG